MSFSTERIREISKNRKVIEFQNDKISKDPSKALVHIALSDKECDIRLVAVDNLDPKEHLDVLVYIAQNDDEPKVRMAALIKFINEHRTRTFKVGKPRKICKT